MNCNRFWIVILGGFLICSCNDFSFRAGCLRQFSVQELAPDGVWTWFNDERSIVNGERLIIGSLDSEGICRVDVYDMQSGARQSDPLSSWQSRDDHNNPALLELEDGRILACYAQHGTQKQWYWRIADILEGGRLQWRPEQVFQTSAGTTYCNLVQLSAEDGRIYNFSRSVGFNPNIQYSEDAAESWQGPFELIRSGDQYTRPYVKYADNGTDRIDFVYTDGHPRNEPRNNVYHVYYQAGAFYKSNGTKIKSFDEIINGHPLVPSDGTLIYDGSTEGRGWIWDLEYDRQGHPVAVLISAADGDEGNDLRYRYAYWDAQKQIWYQQQIAFAGSRLYVPENHYAGGITLDPERTNAVYISCDVDPATGRPNETGRYQIFRGETSDAGKSWTWRQLTFDTDVDNLRPFVPRKHGCSICVVWFQGQYNTYVDYKTRIVGIIKK